MWWLKDYEGKSVWIHNPPPPQEVTKKPLLDRLGREIKLGDFVCYADTIYRSKVMTYFGKVTQISKINVCYCTNIKLSEDDRVCEIRIKDNSSLILIDDKLMENLMMRRLSL